MEYQEIINSVSSLLWNWAPKVVGAIIILVIGFWIAGWAARRLTKVMTRSNFDPDVMPFLSSLTGVVLKILVVITAAAVVGIEVTAFAAMLAAIGLAIGMALQGSLGHFASGILILTFKPYHIGDLVKLKSELGVVEEIHIFNTIIRTLDNKKVIVPNGLATGDVMINYSAYEKIRVDMQVAMPYEQDFDRFKSIIQEALEEVTVRLPDEPTIEMRTFSETGIVIDVRVYAPPKSYWAVNYACHNAMKAAFAREKLTVAYPRRMISSMDSFKFG